MVSGVNAVLPPARLLAAALEPVAGQVHFSPECHAKYVALGFGPSPAMAGRTAMPDRCAYFTSRGSLMGQVAGEVVAAAFAVFNPSDVIDCVARGWQLTNAVTIRAARQQGAVAQLRRILGPDPAGAGAVADRLLRAIDPLPLSGRPLFAGQRAGDTPEDPWARLWRAADTLREFRGDSHTIAWTSAGFDAIEIGLLSDLFWGLAPRSHTKGRGWSPDQLAGGEERLRGRGLLVGEELSSTGSEQRAAIEAHTDAQLAPALAVLGDDLSDIVRTLTPWGDAVRDAGGYLSPAVRFTSSVG